MNIPSNLQKINSQPVYSDWSKTTWFLWLILPVLLLEFISIFGISYTDGFVRASYVAFQKDFFIALNAQLSVLPNALWLNMTYLGDGVVVFALMSFLLIVRAQAWAAMFASILFASVVTNLGKAYFSLPRPATVLDDSAFNIIGETLIGYSSFPSGHSITISFVSVSILATLLPHPENLKQSLKLFAGFLVLGIFCLSRVAVGAHWPMDVVAGAGCGWLVGLVGVSIARVYTSWWQSMLTGKLRFVLVGLLLLLSGILIVRAFHETDALPIISLAAMVSLFVSYVLFRFPVRRYSKG